MKKSCKKSRCRSSRSPYSPRTSNRGRRARLLRARPLRVEPLEDRRMLAVFTVSNLNDAPVAAAGDAPGTLRQALFDANAAASEDEIVFAPGVAGTLLLTEGQLEIADTTTITGPGAARLTLEAFDPTPLDDNGDGSRIFLVDDGNATVEKNVTISGLTLTGGDVSSAGGAIFSLEDLNVVRSHITGNSVNSTAGFITAGGGIYINMANLVVEDSTISHNYAYHDDFAIGGGIASGQGNVIVRNSTITGNRARTPLGLSGGLGYGGGMAVGTGTHTFAFSTISNNRAIGMDSFGGGIFAFGTEHVTTLDHAIVGNNFGEFGQDLSTIGSVTLRYSLVETNSGFTFTDGGGNLLGVDPGIDNELIDYGGPTPTLLLRPGSAVIDQGDPAAVAGSGGVPIFDQRDDPFDRVADGDGNASAIIDIGAVEFQSVAGLSLIVNTLVDENDGDFSAGELSLREATGLSNGSVGADTITFAEELSGQSIILTEGELRIVDDLTIDASSGTVTIDASGNDPTPNVNQGDGSRVFNIEARFRQGSVPLDVTLIGMHLTGGDVSGDGGAITSRETLQLVDMTIAGNYVTGYGGGVNQGNSNTTLTITGSTISGNIATGGTGNLIPVGYSTRGGGGIRVVGANTEILSSTISGNRATGNDSHGGGIAAIANDLAIRHSTIAGNSTSGSDAYGGNIAFRYGDNLVLDHTIVANGFAADDNDLHSPSDPVLANNSLIEDATGLTINGAGNVTGVDPNLGPLVNNGGRTRTHALLPGSAAIDGGAFTFTGPPVYDQRDDPFIRVANGDGDAFTIVDIGAYERQSVAGLNLVVDLEVDESDGNYIAGDLSLREAIGLANGSIGSDTITFAPEMLGKTITLTLGEMQIVDSVSIDATSLGGHLTLDASGNDPTATALPSGDGSRIMTIDDGDDFVFIDVELIGLTLTGGDVLGNGGAITTSEKLTVRTATLTDNAAISFAPLGNGAIGAGGAIEVHGGGSLVLDNTTIHKNGSDVAGGVAVNEGDLTLNSSTISGNVAESHGGGLWAAGAGATIAVNHSTIAANFATGSGGGIFARGGASVTLNHSIVADNQAGVGPDLSSVNTVVFDHGWVENGTGFTPTGGLQFIGVDPRLSNLGDHGGATLTHALEAGSAAIDAGNLFFAGPPNQDQRGAPFVRVFDGDGDTTPRIDIGAYERQTLPGLNLVVDVVIDQVNGNFNAGDLSLREAVSLANGSVGGDAISFASELSGATITLAQGELTISEDVTIDAMPLADNVIVDASGSDPTPAQDNGDGSRVFAINDNDVSELTTVTLAGLELTGGDVAGDGGAVFSTESLQIEESTIHNNASSARFSGGGFSGGSGGGVFAVSQNLVVRSSTIHGNTAIAGGGIAVSTADMTLVNSTISSNEAAIRGGGILASGTSNIDVANSTISDNIASASFSGGGIYTFSNVNLTVNHTIVANNQAGSAPDISAAETVLLTYSLIEDASGFTSVGSPNITGQDPSLGPLADNGGPTPTHALLNGSAAIDAGEFGIASPPDYDQRGAPFDRIVANLGSFEVIDIGAFEVQASSGADFDMNGTINGHDFLLWQRGFGTPAPNAVKGDGDADDDGDVDADDLTIWEGTYGDLLPSAAAAAPSGEPSRQRPARASSTNTELINAAFALMWIDPSTPDHEALAVDVARFQEVLPTRTPANNNSAPLKMRATDAEPPKLANDTPEETEESRLADALLENTVGR